MCLTPICVGVIAAVHGIRGQIKVKSFTEFPEDIFDYGPLSDSAGTRSFTLSPCGVSGDTLLATIQGIADRNAAEALKGTKLYIDRSALPETEEDEFYIEDLAGLSVILPDGQPFGIVCGIENYGAGDLMEIVLTNGEKQLFAFTRATFPKIDLSARTITFIAPEEVEAKP